jgi:hypothetical protein
VVVEVEYELTHDDLYHFQWRACFSSPSAKRKKLKFYFYTLLVLVFLSVLPAFASDAFELSYLSFAWILFFFPVFVVAFSIIERRQTQRALLDLLKEEKPGRGQIGTHNVVLNEAGLVESTAVGESRCSWAGVDRVEHDQQYIYIYTAPHAAHIIPKCAFNNLHEAESFYQLARVSKQSAAGTN